MLQNFLNQTAKHVVVVKQLIYKKENAKKYVQINRKNQKELQDKEISDYIFLKFIKNFYLYYKLREKKSKRKQIHRLR